MQRRRSQSLPPSTPTQALVTQILAVEHHASGYLVALPSIALDDAPVIWSAAQLVNRRSRYRSRMCLLIRRPSTVDIAVATDVVVAYLPTDLRMGDLIALPRRVQSAVDERWPSMG